MSWYVDHPADLEIINEIQNPQLSDRLVAVIAVAFLDDRLKARLAGWLIDDAEASNKLLKPNGPLGGYGNRVDLGYSLGMYGKLIRDELAVVGKVRNDFAHRPHSLNFGSKHFKEDFDRFKLIPAWATPDGNFLYGHENVSVAMIIGGPTPVPTNNRGRFLVTVELLFAAVSLQTARHPQAAEY